MVTNRTIVVNGTEIEVGKKGNISRFLIFNLRTWNLHHSLVIFCYLTNCLPILNRHYETAQLLPYSYVNFMYKGGLTLTVHKSQVIMCSILASTCYFITNVCFTVIHYQVADFHWTSEIRGLVLGSFFYGYIVTQIPGGNISYILSHFLIIWFYIDPIELIF